MELAILGAGEMGKWFAKFWSKRNWEVTITDADEEKARKVAKELGLETAEGNSEAVKEADIVLVAVPIEETPKVIGEVSSSLKDDALLLDIASVKEEIVEKMKKMDVNSELISIHPLFGPGADTLDGKRIVSIPVKAGDKYQDFKDTLSDSGAKIEEMKAAEHDRIMSITQSLTHFILLTYLSTLNSMKDFPKAKAFQTPIFKQLLDLSKAFLKENPEVCGDIQTENKYSSMARGTALESSRRLNVALEAEDTGIVSEIFGEAQEKLEPEEIEKAYKRIYEELEKKE